MRERRTANRGAADDQYSAPREGTRAALARLEFPAEGFSNGRQSVGGVWSVHRDIYAQFYGRTRFNRQRAIRVLWNMEMM